MSHGATCVGCILPVIFKSWPGIILKGQLKQNFPLLAEITKWDSEVCAVEKLEATKILVTKTWLCGTVESRCECRMIPLTTSTWGFKIWFINSIEQEMILSTVFTPQEQMVWWGEQETCQQKLFSAHWILYVIVTVCLHPFCKSRNSFSPTLFPSVMEKGSR